MDERAPLPTRSKLLYASGSLAGNLLFQATAAWLIFFYSPPADEVGATHYIGALTAGVLLFFGRLIDSLNDPIVGFWSDNARSPLGRRVPFILVGAPLLALAFILVWTPPVGGVSAWNAVYFFCILQFFFVLYTIVRGPYAALLPEIARTSADRVSVSAWEVFFGALGALVGLQVSGIIIDATSFQVMAIVLGSASLGFHWGSLLGVRGHTHDPGEEPTLGLVESLVATMRNRQFLAYEVAYGAFAFGQSALTAVIPFLVDILLDGEDLDLGVVQLGTEGAAGIVIGVFIGGVVLSLPLLQVVTRRRGKLFLFRLSLLTTGLYLPCLAFVGLLPGLPDFPQVFLLAGLGLTMAGVFVLPNALLADVIDFDELLTGQRREAMYFGVQGTIQRIGLALAALTFGVTRFLFGDTAADPWGVRLIGPFAGLVVLGGYLVFRAGYRLPDQVTRESAAHLLPPRAPSTEGGG